MKIARELAKRLLSLVLVLFLVTLFSALLISFVPGDPVDTLVPLAESEQADALKAQVREDLELDEPLPQRYASWLNDFVTGDENGEHFGEYFRVSGRDPVSDRLADALPVSLQLMVYAQVLALAIAIPLGVLTAYRAGSAFDKTANTGAFALLAVPNFVLGLGLAYYLGVWLNWLPPSGYVPFGDDAVEHVRRMILPAVTLAAAQVAVYMRLLRSDMVATLQEDFIQMARSKGISDQRVLWRHALRPSSLTLLTVAGLNVGTLIGGAVVVEVIFSIPGMGLAISQAIFERQYVALQSFVAVLAVLYVLVNFAVDVLYTIVDPRIRHARARS
ncbi:MAG TPA: ABC transporter permease [Acidimicrobiales bacterium]|nr:ABC transporter permease [Acidimicrobiales bacterium]